MESVLTYKHKRTHQVLEIVYDEDMSSENVREGSVGKMLCSHRNYSLGDIQIKSQDEFDEYLKVKHFKMPLYLLDHSGLSMRTTKFYEDPQGWDSGMVGYIPDKKQIIVVKDPGQSDGNCYIYDFTTTSGSGTRNSGCKPRSFK